MPILGELARWGFEWAWGPPRPSEAIDIGAIFRLAPGLLAPAAGTQGTVEFTLHANQEGGVAASYSLTASPHKVTIEEREADNPDARVSGDLAAWVSAFSPQHDRSGLALTGDRALAERLLDGLVAVTVAAGAAARTFAA
jgi:hypothetical protein